MSTTFCKITIANPNGVEIFMKICRIKALSVAKMNFYFKRHMCSTEYSLIYFVLVENKIESCQLSNYELGKFSIDALFENTDNLNLQSHIQIYHHMKFIDTPFKREGKNR